MVLLLTDYCAVVCCSGLKCLIQSILFRQSLSFLPSLICFVFVSLFFYIFTYFHLLPAKIPCYFATLIILLLFSSHSPVYNIWFIKWPHLCVNPCVCLFSYMDVHGQTPRVCINEMASSGIEFVWQHSLASVLTFYNVCILVHLNLAFSEKCTLPMQK